MKKVKKLLPVFLLIGICTNSVYSQDNVAKLGLGIVFGNIKLGYERVISENQSITINAGMMIPRDISIFFDDYSGTNNVDNKLSSYSGAMEYRFYSSKNPAPKGFYFAPYARVNRYRFDFADTYNAEIVKVDNKFTNMGVGLQLGYQWVISGVVTIDWFFLGLGVDRNVYSAKFTTNAPNYNYSDLEYDINSEMKDIPIIGKNFTLETGDDYVKGKTSFLLPGIRTGFSIGIAF